MTITGESLARADIAALAGSAPVSLIDCDLAEAELGRLDLSGWRFERCGLRRADFSGARLERTHWRSCRGAFATFTGAELGDAVFVASDFNNALLRGATLPAASFTGCKLTGADFTDARALELRFEETLLIDARLAGFRSSSRR
ncbi:Pentapeptide repeat-containing protein [Sphingomonas sp. NFR15]|nr:Pentapeptide repeat-containing protein [Sphingomonas sp. NFR15]